MRKIETESILEAKRKKRARYLSLLMLLILLAGTAGYAFGTSERTNDNDPISDNLNGITINNEKIIFSYPYSEVSNISTNIYVTRDYLLSKKVYYVGEGQIPYELGASLGRYASGFQEACYGPCERNLPEKNCTENLIIWNKNLNNKVYQTDNCIFIEGDLRAMDAFLYSLFKK